MRKTCIALLFISLSVSLSSLKCKKDDEEEENSEIVGNPGNPRFNLRFTNETNVDLDLYVRTPNGTVISYANSFGQGGTLDVDCLCGSCPDGPSENIYWQDGTAPNGTYQYWVEYYDDCNGGSPSSTFTLRLMKNGTILETKTGTLSASNRKSTVYSFTK